MRNCTAVAARNAAKQRAMQACADGVQAQAARARTCTNECRVNALKIAVITAVPCKSLHDMDDLTYERVDASSLLTSRARQRRGFQALSHSALSKIHAREACGIATTAAGWALWGATDVRVRSRERTKGPRVMKPKVKLISIKFPSEEKAMVYYRRKLRLNVKECERMLQVTRNVLMIVTDYFVTD